MLNKVQLIGNLGKDPEVKQVNSKSVCNFSIATSESYKDKDGQKQTITDWHDIQVWDKLADICGQYLKKGSKVYIEGKLKKRSYEDKDGVKRYVTDIVCTNMIMLDGKSGEATTTGYGNTMPINTSNPYPVATETPATDDLPF